jgi:RTX calcium-binding nonapeptide repeat (4 copies)/Bacterial Ig-like domain
VRLSRGGGVAALAVTLSIAFAALVPASASAAVTCTFNAGTGALDVDVTAGSTAVSLRVEPGGDDIEVFEGSFATEVTPCGGGQPQTTDTASIQLDDTVSNQATAFILSLLNGPFAPGTGGGAEGGGTPEIEITTTDVGGTGFDVLSLTGGPGATEDQIRFGQLSGGATGANMNAPESGGADGDDLTLNGIERLFIQSGGGDDTITANGTTSEFTGPAPQVDSFNGQGGNDILTAGSNAFGAGLLDGEAGDDILTGGAGTESLDVDQGNDIADGAGGANDVASYLNHNQGVTVDLRLTTQQDTVGAGLDTLMNVESVSGGNASDTITGTAGPNVLLGGQQNNDVGDDTLVGLGGNDTLIGAPGADTLRPGGDNDSLIGSEGNDTVSYADSAGGVTFSLDPAFTGVAQSTGGAGNDTLADSVLGMPQDPDANHEVENLTGSPFADNLTGNDLPNRIVGGSGGDTISLLGGADEFEVLDGLLDTVNCGGDADSGVADEIGVDTINADCETTDFAPQTSISGGPANGAKINDRTPTYSLSANEPATFERRVDGGSFQSCPATCTIPTLPDGSHTVAFRATDSDLGHNTTDQTPAMRTVTVDTAPPQTTITEGPGDATNDPTPTFRFSSNEAGSTFQCRVDGGSFAGCSSPRTTAALDDGQHTFAVRARDQATNLDPSPASRAFTVDTDPPETTITKGPRKKTRKKKVTFEFSADEPGASFECALDGAAFSPCQSPMTVKAKKKGKHSFEIRSTDEAGNVDPTPDTHTWKRKKRRR